MKAISILQPWASLCVLTYKCVEVITKGSNVQEAIKNAHAEWLNHYWELFMEERKIY